MLPIMIVRFIVCLRPLLDFYACDARIQHDIIATIPLLILSTTLLASILSLVSKIISWPAWGKVNRKGKQQYEEIFRIRRIDFNFDCL